MNLFQHLILRMLLSTYLFCVKLTQKFSNHVVLEC